MGVRMSVSVPVADEELHRAVARMQAATDQFVSGDNAVWKSLCSCTDDATMAGGWGDYEQGWDAVGPRYDWAAARFAGGEMTYDMGASGDLAYTFGIERGAVRLAGMTEPTEMALRVTHVYRREDGDWKLLHRHADPLMSKQAVEAVIQR